MSGKTSPIVGGRQKGYFPEPGVVIPANGMGNQTIDQSIHTYQLVSNTRDPENTILGFMEQNRRAKLRNRNY